VHMRSRGGYTSGIVRFSRSFQCMREAKRGLPEPTGNMPLLRSLMKVHGALAAIDMALLRSFSSRFMVPVHVRNRRKLSMNRAFVEVGAVS